MAQTIVLVAVEQIVYSIDRQYSYILPDDFSYANVGCRVIVPFGKGNKVRQGLILKVESVEEVPKGLKSVIDVPDRTPILNEEFFRMCGWLKEKTFATYFDVLKFLIPPGAGLRISDGGVSRRVGDATVKMAKICKGVDLDNAKLTPKQQSVIDFIKEYDTASVKEILYFTGVTKAVITNLEKYGIIELYDVEYYRTPIQYREEGVQKTELSAEQQTVYNGLIEEYEKGYSTSLLYGVTGSGKTQVFLKMAEYVLSLGKGVIIMVPEIALTPQTISTFNSYFGNTVAVFHSAMTQAQRYDEYKRVKDGNARLAIGTRSAVFAPFDNLGLIVMDEEQEHTYKSDKSPRFHARDVAKYRCSYHKCMLLLASATPSVETFALAKAGNYNFFKLSKRYGKAVLPTVETVDMKQELVNGNYSKISNSLLYAMDEALSSNGQVILLLNRRGYNTHISCVNCGEVASCPNCSISLTYHTANNRLMCHYCGYSVPYTSSCPTCGGKHLRNMGIGTQKVCEELERFFPNARILRMDADTNLKRGSYEKNLTDFADGKYDIMVGTQMVAKGLNFPNVTLVGVLSTDGDLYNSDFRAAEKTFDLLTQVVGRGGRGDKQAKAIIQTVDPTNPVIELASKQDYEEFFEEEIMARKVLIYPPYCDLTLFIVTGDDHEEVRTAAKFLASSIADVIKNEYSEVKVSILGPVPTGVPKVNNKYRFRLIMKHKRIKQVKDVIDEVLVRFNNKYKTPKVMVSVDVNPTNII